MRQVVTGHLGDSVNNVIYFSTNDPNVPEHKLRITVSVVGGLEAQPRSVVFGTVVAGEEAVQVVDLIDHTVPPRQVRSVVSDDPERVEASLLPPDGREYPSALPQCEEGQSGSIVGRVAVRLLTGLPGRVESMIRVRLASETRLAPTRVTVTAHVVSPVTIAPAKVFLPIQSADGPIHTATCLLKSARGKPLSAVVVTRPPGFDIDVLPSESLGAAGTLHVRVTDRQPDAMTIGTGRVVLSATVEGVGHHVEFEVVRRPKE